jgi:cytochrome c-type biogenesis protein CcmF
MAILSRYMNHPVEMPVRAIVSPMVVWIWIGGAIALCGSLLALWPAPSGKRREVASAYKARLGRELTTKV